MSKKKPDLESKYANRRKKILKQIKGEAALFCSSPVQTLSRDQFHAFHQNRDFLYLTGIKEPESALLLLGSSRGPRSILFLRDKNPAEERWNGERLGIKAAKRRFRVDEVRLISNFEKDLPGLLIPSRVLHFAPGSHPKVDSYVWSLFSSPVGPRLDFPHTLRDSRLLTSQMRMVKDRDEIRTMRHVADITAEAFLSFAADLKKAKSEKHAARLLESHFTRLGAEGPAFPTIVASGKNATILHHTPAFQPLWKRELVLIDAGASFQGYSADISRTFPMSGTFSTAQAEIYDLVHQALTSGISMAKPNSSLDAIHRSAVRILTQGLVRLGILQGTVSELIEKGAHLAFYMHRTGHWLGLDVHDVSSIYCDEVVVPPTSRPLEPGNVITVEPGLYFDPKNKGVPKAYRGIGVRIEEDVLITQTGREILTSHIPSRREEIEMLMSRCLRQ